MKKLFFLFFMTLLPLAASADATQQVKDYYPRYTREDESVSEAINTPEQSDVQEVSYILAHSTNTGENTSSSYAFENGLTITNQSSKGYATGKNDGLKYSANVQYTINLPADVTVKSITFTGYDNYDDTDSYLGEVDGVAYDATTYVFPKTKETVTHTISLSAAKEKITFTPKGKQVVLIITLNGYKGDPAGISVPYADPTLPKCETPSIFVQNGKIKFQCNTPDAEFTSTLTSSETFTGSEVVLGNELTYTIKVYATAPGFNKSETATATFTFSKTDLNGDGTIDVGDIMAIINQMARK